jgi:hypothetical protein
MTMTREFDNASLTGAAGQGGHGAGHSDDHGGCRAHEAAALLVWRQRWRQQREGHAAQQRQRDVLEHGALRVAGDVRVHVRVGQRHVLHQPQHLCVCARACALRVIGGPRRRISPSP